MFAFASLLLWRSRRANGFTSSRTLCQGTPRRLVSLVGTISGVTVHMVAAARLTALLLAVPVAFDAIRFIGALYLLWLAVSTLRGGGFSFRAACARSGSGPRLASGDDVRILKSRLVLPRPVPAVPRPGRRFALAQSLTLGVIQIAIAIVIDGGLVLVTGLVAARLAAHPHWLAVQRWVLGVAFGVLAAWLAFDSRKVINAQPQEPVRKNRAWVAEVTLREDPGFFEAPRAPAEP